MSLAGGAAGRLGGDDLRLSIDAVLITALANDSLTVRRRLDAGLASL